MAASPHVLINGGQADICTFGNGHVGAFEEFLVRLGEEREAGLLCLLDQLSQRGSIENPDIVSSIPNTVGLKKAAIAGVELVFFRHGRKLIICCHAEGKLTQHAVAQAKWAQTDWFNQAVETKQ